MIPSDEVRNRNTLGSPPSGENMETCTRTSSVVSTDTDVITRDVDDTVARPSKAARVVQQGGCADADDDQGHEDTSRPLVWTSGLPADSANRRDTLTRRTS